VIEWSWVLPPLPERESEISDRRSAHLGLRVVPRRTVAVAIVQWVRLWVAEVARVVVAAMTQIDASDECDVLVFVAGSAKDDEFLMVTPEPAYALIE
jgi:hypothetical protein